MLQKPHGYDEATAGGGDYTPLSVGGHYLTILRVREIMLRDQYPALEIVFDTHSTDDQPRYYQDSYESAKDRFPDARYQGVHNLFLPTGDPNSDTYKWSTQRLKGFITSVEESNSGYVFDWQTASLKGKNVGGVFGEEEYYNRDGDARTAVRLRYFCSTESVPTAKPPKLKEAKNKPVRRASFSAPHPDDAGDLPFQL